MFILRKNNQHKTFTQTVHGVNLLDNIFYQIISLSQAKTNVQLKQINSINYPTCTANQDHLETICKYLKKSEEIQILTNDKVIIDNYHAKKNYEFRMKKNMTNNLA